MGKTVMVYEITETRDTVYKFRGHEYSRVHDDYLFNRVFEAPCAISDEDGVDNHNYLPVESPHAPHWLIPKRIFHSIAIRLIPRFRIASNQIRPDGGIKLPAYEVTWWLNDKFELEPYASTVADENYIIYDYAAKNLTKEEY